MIRRSAVILSLVLCVPAAIALGERGTIGHIFAHKTPVKAHVGSVINESGDGAISVDLFKSTLESSLNKRKVMDFDTVGSPAESDILISAVIKKYQYMERGPLKPKAGAPLTIVDAVATATSNYVEMKVFFTVTDSSGDKVLWTDLVEDYIKQDMTPAESVPLIFDKITRKFISQCFGRPHETPTVKEPM